MLFLIRRASNGQMSTVTAKTPLGALRKFREDRGAEIFDDIFYVKERGHGGWEPFRLTPNGKIKVL